MTDSTPTDAPSVISREDAPSSWMVDSVWSMLATAETTGGALTVLDQTMPARSGPPPHVHDRLHASFSVLDGEIRFQIGTELRTASARSLTSIPPGTVHGFAVASETGRVLNLSTPGGFTEQISSPGTPAIELRLPTNEEQPRPTGERWNAHLTRSAEPNTQRGAPTGTQDLLAGERNPFDPFSPGWSGRSPEAGVEPRAAGHPRSATIHRA